MAQALYLKYRPQTFDQVEGQEHVTRTLKNALALDRIAHAYLFTGPRGTGKTSTARILAKAVNCVSTAKEHPCNECIICRAINQERLLDLIEIDAASNTGVDDIRELRDKVDFRPSEARFKVYIVDEAHMLSNAAFNALLKTLEEPPPHVIFVLATTEPNKIPATIASRCQRFDFRRATLPELTRQLSEIAAKENLEIEAAAIELVARQATGSFRDATSLLDQLTAFSAGTITLAQVQGLLGAASQETVHEIVAASADRDVARGMGAIGHAVDAGADPRQLGRDVVDYLRGVLLFQTGGAAAVMATAETQAELSELARRMSAEQVLRAIHLFNQAIYELRGSASPTLPLEMAFVESTLEQAAAPASAATPARHESTRRPAPLPPRPAEKTRAETPPDEGLRLDQSGSSAETKPEPVTREDSGDEQAPLATAAKPEGPLSLELVREQWPALLARLHRLNKQLEAILKDAEAIALAGDLITVGFFYELHKTKVEGDKRWVPQIEKILSELTGAAVKIKCVVSPKKQKIKAAQDDPLVRAALNMGGKIKDVS